MRYDRTRFEDFLEDLMWLVNGNCSGHEIEAGLGCTMSAIRRRLQRNADALRDVTPAWPRRELLLSLDRKMNELDVEARNPLLAA